MTAAALLPRAAAALPRSAVNFPRAAEDTDKAAPLGLLVVILLGIASYWLFRSMSRQLRKVQHGFVEPAAPTLTTTPSDPAGAVGGIDATPVLSSPPAIASSVADPDGERTERDPV